MTLILVRASQRYVLQVTDRLITRDRAAFDELSNKSILYCARNAIVAVAYTGHAFLGDIPTDQWIVEKLTGTNFDQSLKPPALSFVTLSPWLDIGRSLELLREKLDGAGAEVQKNLRPDWRRKPFVVVVAGWQWDKKGHTRPILAGLSKRANSETFGLGYESRDWYLGGRFHLIAEPSSNIGQARMHQLVDELSSKSIDETEMLLVDTVRQVSACNPHVGPHCLSILILPPGMAQARIRYVPASPSNVILRSTSSEFVLTVAYSPWLIGPKMLAAPALISGKGSDASLGPYHVHIEGPDHPNMLNVMISQQRPKAP